MFIIVLLAIAVVCFVLGAAGATKPAWNWVPLGLAFFAGAFLVSNIQAL